MRFATNQGFNSGDQFFTYLKDSFDVLYEKGKRGAAKMLSVGLHCRLVSRPGRAGPILRYVGGQHQVWVCRRIEIAHHWHEHHGGTP
jgi:peptidoglycan/xylan/chitin deacetylase (PgdA/CDA1 family)